MLRTISYKLLPVLLILIAGFLQQYAVYCQIGLTYDSMDYISAAQSFAEKGILLNADKSWYVERAPLYPIILSFFGQGAMQIIVYLNLLSFTGGLIFLFYLSQKLLISKTLQILFLATQVFSVSNLLINSFLWSETIFVFLFSLHLIFLLSYYQNQKIIELFGMCLTAFLFCLQRNTGSFLVFGTVLSMIFFIKKPLNFIHLVFYCIFSLSGWLFWIGYCFSLKGIGFHPASSAFFQNITANLFHYTNVISTWFLPLSLNFWLRTSILIFSVIIFMVFLKKSGLSLPKKTDKSFLKSLIFISVIYLLILISLEDIGFHESERYLSPVFPFIFLQIFVLLDFLYQKKRRYIQKGMILLLLLWLLYPISRSLKNIELWHQRNCEVLSPQPPKGVF